jgi:Bacterial Ig-like domain (group 3)
MPPDSGRRSDPRRRQPRTFTIRWVVLATLVGGCAGSAITAGLLGGERSSLPPALPAAHRVASVTTVTSSLSPSVFGRPVTFTAAVTLPAGGIEPPTGTVRFTDASTLLGTAAVSGGKAALTTDALDGGAHTIIATYGGDLDVASSTGSVTQRVDPARTRLVASPVALAAFQLSATLTQADTGASVAGRTVVMSVAGEVVCRAVTRDTGTATCNGFSGALEILFHKGYTASFAGDPDYRPSSDQGGIL